MRRLRRGFTGTHKQSLAPPRLQFFGVCGMGYAVEEATGNGGDRLPMRALIAIIALSAFLGLAPAMAQQQTCSKADFEAVVDEAASALRDLNLENKPTFQEKLRSLKDKRGWSHDDFIKNAEPFVRDDKIAVFDARTADLLSTISTMGQEGADAKTPDCALLADLQAHMKTLVDTQTEKWTYMFGRIDAALKK